MTGRFLGCLAIALLSACPKPRVTGTDDEPLRVSPTSVSFEDAYVGHPRVATVTLASPSRASRTVRCSTSAPFSVPESIEVPGGSDVTLELAFTPSSTGPHAGVLTLEDETRHETLEVPLAGAGIPVPKCSAPTACRTPTFDFDQRACVDMLASEGTDCTSSLGCFVSAQCAAGECRGTAVTCDDGNPCTLDVCSDVGCGNIDGLPYCPTSNNPCLAPTCSRDAGCGFEAVPDGTACGERTCNTALVCITGACVRRTPPRDQTCAERLVGIPAGAGFVDGRGEAARFSEVVSMAARGDELMVLDTMRVRRVRNGAVVTIAGQFPGRGAVDGFGRNASLASRYSGSIAATGTPGLYFLGDETTIRLVTSSGQVTTLAGSADAGGFLDGVGVQARLRLDSPLRRGGTGARFLQQHSDGTRSPLLIREVSSTGAVHTLGEVDVVSLLPNDGGSRWSIFPLGVAETGPEVVAHLIIGDDNLGGVSYDDYALVLSGGQVTLRPDAEQTWWRNSSVAFSRNGSCRLKAVFDGGFRLSPCTSVNTNAFDGEGGAYYATDEHLGRLTASDDRDVAGPIPDRRQVDGDRDAGRLSYPARLSAGAGGVWFVDYSPNTSVRFARLTGSGSSIGAAVETLDAGLRGIQSALEHQGQLLVFTQDGVLSAFDLTTRVPRGEFSRLQPGNPLLASNGSELRVSFGNLRALQADGGLRPIDSVMGVSALAAGDGGAWFAFGQSSSTPGILNQLLRIEPDDSVVPIAGNPLLHEDTDGPAMQAGVSTVRDLAVLPDGSLVFLSSGNRLKRLANGQITTLFTFADEPRSLAALPDGTLVVAVDAALLRVIP